MNEALPWVILFLPLASAVCITLFALRSPRISAVISVGAIFIAFLCSVTVFMNNVHAAPQSAGFVWLDVGKVVVPFGIYLDPMSLLMLLIVTGVGSAIHLYSAAYMKGDSSFSRFFACLSLFTFSMLGVVMSDNFVQMFIFWELVGVCSYLLVGFWFERPSAADAAKKAFLTNRIGDFGFLTGIILVWAITGTVSFNGIFAQLPILLISPVATAAGLLIFCGAVGKSAQFPLHVWLPDAMEGPTPVSALIHAATMVAAGVYMLCRVFLIFNVPVLQVIAWIGGITALMSGLIACQQNDIKRILAYSTLSQLGYMVMAVGLAAPGAAMFHLATHAFFKALLFLGAGSVIHALHDEQDIWKMGRLKEKMPVTYWTFLIGTLALCGLWPFSGFFSKDGILGAAYTGNRGLFVLGEFVAFLTTFYMFRLFFVAFLGKAKSDRPAHAHESPAIMTLPLAALAIASLGGAFFGIQQLINPLFHEPAPERFALFAPFQEAPVAAGLGLAAFFAGLLAAWSLYRNAASDPIPEKMQAASTLLRNKFYFDEIYAVLIRCTQDALARFANGFDTGIKLLVRAVEGTTEVTGRLLRLVQSGNLQGYTFLFAAGMALVLYLILLR
jgi:NADH-quinone oxidoreductase subunit L